MQQPRQPAGRSLGRAAWWAADYAYAVGRQVAALASRATPDDYTRPVPAVAPPVLLLPGIYETWRFLQPLARELHAHGHPVHVVTPFGLNRAAVPVMADLAAAQLVATDLTDAVVVAHSKGGLIGKSLMGRADVGWRLRGMIAINTPFSGSPYARYLPLRSVRAFLPTDEVLTALAARHSDDTRIVSVSTRFDPHIPGGSDLPGARNVRLVTPGHFRVLQDPELVPVVLAELARLSRLPQGDERPRPAS